MLSLILPTYNESENLPDLLAEVEEALRDIPFEVIVVDDDSPDRTWEIAATLGNHVRVLRRIGCKGLSSAVVEGFFAAEGDVLAVMDADGQHDPALLPKFYKAIKAGATAVVGSRYIQGGSVEGWEGTRKWGSKVATLVTRLACATSVHDPLSGFFAVDRKAYQSIASKLKPSGFKILLEVLGNLPSRSRVQEIPLVFRLRQRGESKLSAKVQRELFGQLVRLFLRRWQTFFLWVIFLLVAAVLFSQLWPIRLLYLDSAVRDQARAAVERYANENGYLISGSSIESLTTEELILRYRIYRRGLDREICARIALKDGESHPCNL